LARCIRFQGSVNSLDVPEFEVRAWSCCLLDYVAGTALVSHQTCPRHAAFVLVLMTDICVLVLMTDLCVRVLMTYLCVRVLMTYLCVRVLMTDLCVRVLMTDLCVLVLMTDLCVLVLMTYLCVRVLMTYLCVRVLMTGSGLLLWPHHTPSLRSSTTKAPACRFWYLE
jgi:hypothetical protein